MLKRLLTAVLLVLISMATAFAQQFTLPLTGQKFTTLDGDKYTDATVRRVEPDGIVIADADGIRKLKFKNLPPEVGAKYGYNPAKAAAFQASAQAAEIAAQNQTSQLQGGASSANQRSSSPSVNQPTPVQEVSPLASAGPLASSSPYVTAGPTPIGETPDQSDARYGTPTKITEAGRAYQKAGFQIGVMYFNGISDEILYKKSNQNSIGVSDEISANEIEILLQKNQINSPWKKRNIISMNQQWLTEDEKMFAEYNPIERTLFIATMDAMNRDNAEKKAQEAEKLQGL